jgi:hypothetical protein
MAKKITAENILRIVDIGSQQLSPETLAYLENEAEPIYKDQSLKEDIFNPFDMLEKLEEDADQAETIVQQEIQQIAKLANQKNAGYFRIIYH